MMLVLARDRQNFFAGGTAAKIGKIAGIACCLLSIMSPPAWGYDAIVKKETFSLDRFDTINGGTIKNVQIGYETYGTLSANKDNVILLCHGSINNSHFAGKYHPSEPRPGLWDHVIGPGNIIDTDKYFVIASDSLTNVSGDKNPRVITTGPASMDPDRPGERYGMRFPIVTIADFVNTQKRLLDSLGIRKLHAVMGYSMGGMQALEWAARYPDMVERAIPVVPQAEQGPYNIELKDVVMSAIKLDPNWNKGDYYGKAEPEEGLFVAYKAFKMTVTSYQPLERDYGRIWAEIGKNPAKSMDYKFAVQAAVDREARSAAKNFDANSWIYIAHALNLFQTGHEFNVRDGLAKIRAKVLFIPSKSDLLMFPDFSKTAQTLMKSMGKDVDLFELEGDGGHSELVHIEKAEAKLRAFLN
jgi:homoserine O-acetyltransferase/O-succinyltransferase